MKPRNPHEQSAPWWRHGYVWLVIAGPVHARIRFSSQTLPECFTVTVRGTRGWAETDLFQPHLRVVMPRKGGEQLTSLVNHFHTSIPTTNSRFSDSSQAILNKRVLSSGSRWST